MQMDFLQKYEIKELNREAMNAAKARLDNLVKPPGSLGELESIAEKLAGISGQIFFNTSPRCVVIMASDNGVVEEGVAAAPQVVTYTQTINFTRGITGVTALAKQFNTDLIIVDVGINEDFTHPMVKDKKIRKSTNNIAHRPAMSYEEAVKAILVGIETAVDAVNSGYKMLGAGEMGIGNTTTSAAMLCAFTGLAPEEVTGKGAGLKDDAYSRKIETVRMALNCNQPNLLDPVDLIAKVGGFDIAAMAGLYLGGAHMGVPVVIDGFISMVAALAAYRINPLVKDYMIASHASIEPGYKHAAKALGIEPCLHLNMRLGEGSGCPIMFAVIDAACTAMINMATFEEANIGEEYLDKI